MIGFVNLEISKRGRGDGEGKLSEFGITKANDWSPPQKIEIIFSFSKVLIEKGEDVPFSPPTKWPNCPDPLSPQLYNFFDFGW